jgi:ectoine hydroxylase-related dioxygenase (phytanoyl-CoA dioxygenase family)
MNREPEAWRRAYLEDGFVVVPDLLDAATLDALRAALAKIVSDVESVPAHLKEKLFFERQHVKNNQQYYAGVLSPEDCGDAVRQIEDLALFDPVFASLIRHEPTLDVLEALFDSAEFSLTYLNGRPKAARFGNGVSDGHFHRDTPSEEFTSVNTILAITCLDPMTEENGPIEFIRGSHKVSDEAAKQHRWRDVARDEFEESTDRVVVNCEAGSGVFFNTKTLHAAGHNRSERTRHTVFSEWVGPCVLPTSPERHAYEGLRPRSRDPLFRKQLEMTFREAL